MFFLYGQTGGFRISPQAHYVLLNFPSFVGYVIKLLFVVASDVHMNIQQNFAREHFMLGRQPPKSGTRKFPMGADYSDGKGRYG